MERQPFNVRKGGSHYYNKLGQETDANGTVLPQPEADYHIAGDVQQIIQERKSRRVAAAPTIAVHKEVTGDVDSEALHRGEDRGY